MDNIKGKDHWNLIWSDEFDGPAKSALDPSKWNYDLGAGGWGNHELEEYTNDIDNVFLDGEGHLAIRVTYQDGVYKSARIKTAGLFEVKQGKIEARIKVPCCYGVWSAFWMLGNNFSTDGWPECGEIDIMEHIGREPSLVHGTLHGPGYSGAQNIHAQLMLPNNVSLAESFHVFGVEWSADAIEFFLDGNSYARTTAVSLPTGSKWVYDHPFFLLLNVAVGGDWAKNPDSTAVFPQTMLVDWVRVWGSQ